MFSGSGEPPVPVAALFSSIISPVPNNPLPQFLIHVIPRPVGQLFAALPLEDKVRILAIQKWGDKATGDNRPRIIKVEKFMQIDGEDQGGYLVKIQYRASDSLTINWTRKGIVNDAMELIQAMLASPVYSEVKIFMFQPYLVLTDKYGQESEDQVAKISIRRATAEKINWKNITPEMFEQLVREEQGLWLHPSFSAD